MDYNECELEDPEIATRIRDIYIDLGILREDGNDLWHNFVEARRGGDLPPVSDATCADDYVQKTRIKLSAWVDSITLVQSETFEAKLSRRLDIRKKEMPRDIRPHEQAVLEFRPKEEERPNFIFWPDLYR